MALPEGEEEQMLREVTQKDGAAWSEQAQETPQGPFPAHPADSPTPSEGKGWRDVELLCTRGSVAREQRPDLRAAAEETGAECAACLARGAQRADILSSTPLGQTQSQQVLHCCPGLELLHFLPSHNPQPRHKCILCLERLFWHLPETTAERKSFSTKRIYSGATGTRSNVGEEGTVGNG